MPFFSNIFSCGKKKVKQNNLQSIPEWKDTKEFIPPIDSGYVIKVLEGTRVIVVKNIDGINYRFYVKVRGVDCPSLTGQSRKERELGALARDLISEYILDRRVSLLNVQKDDSETLIADIITMQGVNIGQILVEDELSVPIGVTKKDWGV